MTRYDDVSADRDYRREARLDKDASREPFVARRAVSDDDRREALRLSFESVFVRVVGGAE